MDGKLLLKVQSHNLFKDFVNQAKVFDADVKLLNALNYPTAEVSRGKRTRVESS